MQRTVIAVQSHQSDAHIDVCLQGLHGRAEEGGTDGRISGVAGPRLTSRLDSSDLDFWLKSKKDEPCSLSPRE